MTESSPGHLPPETITALINTALRARQNGDHASARALLRALSARQPDESRIWLALATVAETRDEQRRALEQVIALDPAHPLARRGLARFQTRVAPVTPAPVTATAEIASIATDEALLAPTTTFVPSEEVPFEQEREIRWPLYALLGIAAAIVLLALLLFRPWEPANNVASGDAGTTPLAAVIPVPIVDGAAPTANSTEQSIVDITARPANSGGQPTTTPSVPVVLPTSAPAATRPVSNAPSPTSGADAGAATAPSSSPQPISTQSPNAPVSNASALPSGTFVKNGDWHASLLFPDQAVLLDGSIGTLQPRGRFVLALITLGNDGTVPARIPGSLFSVVDNRGRRYQAQSAASTAYLAAYGRGQHGDLSVEDTIPPGGDNVSIPLIFDVPVDAAGLTLCVGTSAQGWAIGGQ